MVLLEDYELHKAGKKRLAEIVVGFNDGEPEPVPEPVVVVAEVADDAEEVDDAEETTDEADEPGPTGPDPLEVAARMEAMGAAFARFQKSYAKQGPSAKAVLKAREEIDDVFRDLQAAACR